MGDESQTSSGAAHLALIHREACGRVDALIAVLGLGVATGQDDLRWLAFGVCSLTGLCDRLAIPSQTLARAQQTLRGLEAGGDPSVLDEIREDVVDVRRALDEVRVVRVPGRIALEVIADMTRIDTVRLADAHAIPLTAEVIVREGPSVSAPVAGTVVDVIGLVLDHMAKYGCVRGGSIRVELRRDGDDCAVTLGDRGNAESREQTVESPDSLRLDTAATRMASIGGSLAVSAAPWGGTSVVIRVADR